VTVRQQRPTLEEFLQWPDQKPYLELIHGEVRAKAMPDFPHGEVQAELASSLCIWSKKHPGRTMTEQRCILEADGAYHTALPDVAWWPMAQLPSPEAGPIRVAPRLAVEVLSPNDRYGEVQDKVLLYLKAGVHVVWVIDPLVRNVTVYRPGRPPELIATPAPLQDVELPGLIISLVDVFAVCDARPRIQE